MKKFFWSSLLAASMMLCSFGSLQAQDDACCANDCNTCCNDNSYFFEADLLVWQPHQDGLDTTIFTSIEDSTDSNSTNTYNYTSTEDYRYHKFDFHWRPGYRLGAGYCFCEGWVAAARWTHFEGRAEGRGKQDSLKTSGHWRLDYDVVDLTLTTPYYCSCSCFSWNFLTGLKLARIDQKTRAREDFLYIDNNITSRNVTTEPSTDLLHFNSDVRGLGPEIGVNAVWDMGCGFSLYGNAAGALVFSWYKNKLHVDEKSIETTTGTSTSVESSSYEFNSRNNDRVCRLAMDLGLGICWVKEFCACERDFALMFKLGIEHHRWFDNLRSDAFGYFSGGDLYFNGVTLSSSLMF